jgi:hypothetical protein
VAGPAIAQVDNLAVGIVVVGDSLAVDTDQAVAADTGRPGRAAAGRRWADSSVVAGT